MIFAWIQVENTFSVNKFDIIENSASLALTLLSEIMNSVALLDYILLKIICFGISPM